MVPRHALDHRRAARRAADASGAAAARRRLRHRRLPRWALEPRRVRVGSRRRHRLGRDRARPRAIAASRSAHSAAPVAPIPGSLRSTSSSRTTSCSTSTRRSGGEPGRAAARAWRRTARCCCARTAPVGCAASATTGERTTARRSRVQLEAAGFAVRAGDVREHAALACTASLRGRSPHAPSTDRDGIPRNEPSRLVSSRRERGCSRAEARWLARPGAITAVRAHALRRRHTRDEADHAANVARGGRPAPRGRRRAGSAERRRRRVAGCRARGSRDVIGDASHRVDGCCLAAERDRARAAAAHDQDSGEALRSRPEARRPFRRRRRIRWRRRDGVCEGAGFAVSKVRSTDPRLRALGDLAQRTSLELRLGRADSGPRLRRHATALGLLRVPNDPYRLEVRRNALLMYRRLARGLRPSRPRLPATVDRLRASCR